MLSTLLAFPLFAAALQVIPGSGHEDAGTPRLTHADVRILTWRPDNLSLEEAWDLARSFYGRTIELEGRPMQNLNWISDALLICDTPEYSDRLLAGLRRIDALYAPPPEEAAEEERLELLEYQPRCLSADSLLEALSATEVLDETRHSVVPETGLILLQAGPRRLAEVRRMLESIDRAAPQVYLTVQVLRGQELPPLRPAPGELAVHLQRLVPVAHFELLGTGVLRTAAVGGRELAIDVRAARSPEEREAGLGAHRFHFSMVTGSYDAGTGSLTLDQIAFAATDPDTGESAELFRTSTTLRGGEFAVLGVTGEEPIFAVLRARPAD